MIKRSRYIATLLCSLLQVALLGQYSLEGTVIDQSSNQPISGVEVFDNVSKVISITDANGRYIFDNLSGETHDITFFSIDYKSITETLTLTSNQKLNVQLEQLSIKLSSIEIAAKRKELFAIKQLNDVEGTSIFAGKKSEVIVMDLVTGNKANNTGRQVYAQVAGLNIFEGNDGGLQLNLGGRGLDPNRTSNFNTRQNGYDISADVLGYPESYYSPPSEAIENIRIIRGAGSLQYGSQFGGLIDFRLREIPSFKKVEIISNQTLGSFGFFSTFNSIGINKNKHSLNLFYNYKTGDGYRPNSDFDSHNVVVSTEYRFSPKTKVKLEFTYFYYLAMQAGGLTDQQFEEDPRQSTRARNWFEVDWKLYSMQFNHSFSPRLSASFQLFGLDASRKSVGFRGNPSNLNENPITSLDEVGIDGNYLSPRDLIFGRFKNIGAEFRLINNYNLSSKKSVLLVGSKYYQSNNTSEQGPGSTGIDPNFSFYNEEFPDYANQSNFRFPNLNTALFAENIFYLNSKLSLTPGVRIEFIKTEAIGTYNQVVFDNAGNPIANTLLNDDQILRRSFALFGLGLDYKQSPEVNVVANLSQNYRSVTFSDIRVVSPTFIVDPDIKDEKGATLDIGVKGRFKDYLSYDLTAYSILYNDRIGIILDDRANRVRKNIGQALIAGTESLVNINIGRLLFPEQREYKLGCFINSAFTYSRYLQSDENNVVGKEVEFIPKANIKTGLNLGYKSLETSFQYTYLSQQYTDVQNSLKATAGDIRSGVIGEIPSYYILDASMKYSFSHFTLAGGINNVLDRNYFTRRATGYPGPGIIPSEGRSFYITLTFKI